MDENIMGTHYKVIPNNETITIELSFTEGKSKSFVYDTSNHFSSSNTADGSHTWHLKNALSKPYYDFYIVGDKSAHSFTSSCEYQEEIITCKEYINEQYEHLKEYYSEVGVPQNLLYSIFNRVLKQNTSIKHDELFFDSIDKIRINTYKFSLPLYADTIVSYELPTSVQKNATFNPAIYLVEQKHLGNYPVTYTVKLNNYMPYIIESSAKVEQDGTIYKAKTSGDFYFVFSSSKKPVNTLTPDSYNVKDITILIVCIVIGSVALIFLAVFIGIAIFRRKT